MSDCYGSKTFTSNEKLQSLLIHDYQGLCRNCRGRGAVAINRYPCPRSDCYYKSYHFAKNAARVISLPIFAPVIGNHTLVMYDHSDRDKHFRVVNLSKIAVLNVCSPFTVACISLKIAYVRYHTHVFGTRLHTLKSALNITSKVERDRVKGILDSVTKCRYCVRCKEVEIIPVNLEEVVMFEVFLCVLMKLLSSDQVDDALAITTDAIYPLLFDSP